MELEIEEEEEDEPVVMVVDQVGRVDVAEVEVAVAVDVDDAVVASTWDVGEVVASPNEVEVDDGQQPSALTSAAGPEAMELEMVVLENFVAVLEAVEDPVVVGQEEWAHSAPTSYRP